MATWLVRNETPDRLRVQGGGRVLQLAPLQAVRVTEDPAGLGAPARQARDALVLEWAPEPLRSTRERWTALLGVLAVLAVGGAAGAQLTGASRAVLATAAALAVVCVGAIARLNVRDGIDNLDFARAVLVRALGLCLVGAVLLTGVLAPAAAVYYGTELASVVSLDGAVRVRPGSEDLVVARVLQLLLIALLALLPGMMFFQFDREKVGTLLDRWLHHIFRLDPTVHTLADVDAKYGRRLQEFFGISSPWTAASPAPRRRASSPVFVATLLLAIGWVLVLLSTEAAVTRYAPDARPTLSQLFEPASTPVSFAFLGAYFFTLQVVLRGYVRGDLRPKTYTIVSVRILLSFVLAWALQGVAGGSAPVLAVAFLGGIVPDTVLRKLRDVSAGIRLPGERPVRGELALLDEKAPLTDLDGIDLYERTRLAEEGITNIQALAHHDLVDLTLSTRIPVLRVVDWFDQAVLYQHVTPVDRQQLRAHGVRTATELVHVGSSPDARLLDQVMPADRVRLVLEALRGEDWLAFLVCWRRYPLAEPRPVRVYGTQAEGGTPVEVLPALPEPRRRPPRPAGAQPA